jgi:hypothetical protein
MADQRSGRCTSATVRPRRCADLFQDFSSCRSPDRHVPLCHHPRRQGRGSPHPDAEAAAAEAEAGVTAAEEALVAAWNTDGDAEALLGMARERLGPYGAEIAAAIAETDMAGEEARPEAEDGADAGTDPELIVPTGG